MHYSATELPFTEVPRSVGSRCQGRSDTRVTSGPQTYTLPCTLCAKHFLGCAIPCDGMPSFCHSFVSMQFMAYEMCDLCTVKHLLALPCSTTQMARAHIWPAGQPVQSSEVMATGTRSICNILTQVPYVQVEVFEHRDATLCLLFGFPHS